MPLTSYDAHLPRRNARSFDLDDSAAKAAAWVWHLHASKPGITTEGRFISSQSRRRSSGSYDRKASRFQQEATTATTNTAAGGNKTEALMWDCGSNLYDTFELVAFGNRLDRSMMEVAPITALQAHKKEHYKKSPLHEPGGILRSLSLPRSLSRQRSKNWAGVISSPKPNKFKVTKACSTTGSGAKASTKWSSVGKFMKAIKKVVVLHKQVSFLGCKRSTNVIESSQRPLNHRDNHLLVNEKVETGSECILDDDFSIQLNKVRCNSDSISNYMLSIPSKDNSNYQRNIGDKSSMLKKVRAYSSERLGDGLSMSKKIRSNSERMSEGLLENQRILSRRKCAREEVMSMEDWIKGSNLGGGNGKERIQSSNLGGGNGKDGIKGTNLGGLNGKDGIKDTNLGGVNGKAGIKGTNLGGFNGKDGIKGTNLGGVNVKERIKGANEHLDFHKHLHHHHHHHHHHHYLHHNLASESARLSPETMSQICAEQSWLI